MDSVVQDETDWDAGRVGGVDFERGMLVDRARVRTVGRWVAEKLTSGRGGRGARNGMGRFMDGAVRHCLKKEVKYTASTAI